ncbi:hypothetical protein ACFQX6_49955 [Streptosporangium lutulentum]
MFDRRTRVSNLIHETRQDFAYRPRMRYDHRTVRLMRRAVPVIAVLVVTVLTVDLMILVRLPERSSEAVALQRSVATRSAQPVQDTRGGLVEARPTQAAAPPPVAPLTSIRQPHLFIVANKPLSSSVVAKITQTKGCGRWSAPTPPR